MKKIIYLFILIFIYSRIIINDYKNKNIKVCICTVGKKENRYAREYVEFYKNRGVDKIFIYDNNELNDEKFEFVIKDYIDNGFVDIIDFRGIQGPQKMTMEDCRKNNYKNYDWLIFFDMDEFIYLRNFSNIKDFLNQKMFDNCDRIQLNWYFHTDNNLIYYDNRSLSERFTEYDKNWNNVKFGGKEGIKSILRGNKDYIIHNVHVLNKTLRSCDGFGKKKEVNGIITNESDHYYNYIDHYWSKSTEEFMNKLLRGDVVLGNATSHFLKSIGKYFYFSNITFEKIDYIENRTKLNLTKYRLLLMNNTILNK